MSELKPEKERIVSRDWFKDNARQDLCMQRVEIFKEQLKREKQKDKIFAQSIKAKLATRQRYV